jgi:hypothetical protein
VLLNVLSVGQFPIAIIAITTTVIAITTTVQSHGSHQPYTNYRSEYSKSCSTENRYPNGETGIELSLDRAEPFIMGSRVRSMPIPINQDLNLNWVNKHPG